MTPRVHKALDLVAARRDAGLSDETMHLLLLLSMEGQATREHLAAATAINPTTMPRYLSRLIGSGHVVRQRQSADQRIAVFALTPHGVRLVESLLRHFPA
jgi:DNA-binding MarR family transcriptional regulator